MPNPDNEHQRLQNALQAQPLDFKLSDFTKLTDEVEQGLSTLIDALNTVNKFARFLPGTTGDNLAGAIKVLSGLRDALAKLP